MGEATGLACLATVPGDRNLCYPAVQKRSLVQGFYWILFMDAEFRTVTLVSRLAPTMLAIVTCTFACVP
jgi:hypothetical protein